VGNSKAVSVKFRHQTKPPYRILEKAFTKGPARDPSKAPDCSHVLDVYGCIIDCIDFTVMTKVLESIARLHHGHLRRSSLPQVGDGIGEGEGGILNSWSQGRSPVIVSRVKDRWRNPASSGWRDLILNVIVDAYVFEVQVVHHGMLNAQPAGDDMTTFCSKTARMCAHARTRYHTHFRCGFRV
jgi:hypothetical protein